MRRPSFPTLIGLLLVCVANCGCGPDTVARSSGVTPPGAGAALPAVSATELQSLVQRSEQPVLVEFGVNFACFRCDEMRPHIMRLASEFDSRAHVVRVDYNAHRQLAMQLGATICPSYVLFENGQAVATWCYPTSVDLIAAELDGLLVAAGDSDSTRDVFPGSIP